MPVLTRKGQITIPEHIRDLLGIRAGSEAAFEVRGGQVLLVTVPTAHALHRSYGRLKTPDDISTDEAMKKLSGV